MPGAGTVLVVEDDPGVRSVTCDMLRQAGFTVLDGGDGSNIEQVCSRAETVRRRIDALLSDVVMPGRNGLEIARAVRSVFPGLPVLFMSGYSEEGVFRREDLDALGEFIEKPFRPDALTRKLRDLLFRSSRHV